MNTRSLTAILVLLVSAITQAQPEFEAELLPNSIRVTITGAEGVEVREANLMAPLVLYVVNRKDGSLLKVMNKKLSTFLVMSRGFRFRDAVPGLNRYEYSIRYEELGLWGRYDRVGGDLIGASQMPDPLTSAQWRELLGSGELRIEWLARTDSKSQETRIELRKSAERGSNEE